MSAAPNVAASISSENTTSIWLTGAVWNDGTTGPTETNVGGMVSTGR